MLHALVVVAGKIHSQLLRLFRFQIEGIEVAAILENDRVGAEARPHYVEVGEMGELLNLFAAQVVAIEIEVMLGAAIGAEVDGVAVPHGEGVGPFGVWQVFDGIVLEIVDRDRLGQTTCIALPGTEITEDGVVSDFRAVGRKRSQAALANRQGLGQAAFDADAEGAFGPPV